MQQALLDWFALLSNSLLVVCLLLKTTIVERMLGIAKVIFLFVVFGFVLLVPVFKGCTTAQIMRGAFGDLSITTFLVLLFWILNKITNSTIVDPLNKPTAWLIFLLGCILYASSLGFIRFDVYSYGYLHNYALWVLCIYIVIQLILWQFNKIFALIWICAIVYFVFKLQASINLWDYLFDPILWFIAFCTITSRRKKISEDTLFRI